MSLPLLMLVVFGSAKLLAELLEALGQPAIAGEILAGVLIGPFALGWIPQQAIAPDALLSSLGDLGVMFLLFRVGLDVDSARLWKIGRTAALVAASGVTLSFGLALAVLWAAGIPSAEAKFVAAAMAATSVGITAQVLAARKLLSERASQIILAAAVLDDICGLLVLSVVSSSAAGGGGMARIAVTIAVSVTFVAVVARWGAAAVQRVIPRVGSTLRLSEAEFAVSVCLLFALALFSTWTGISAIVGAFLAGMALSASADARLRTLIHGATELLVPFFLVGIGLRLDLQALRTVPMILLAVLLFAAAVLAKVAGCGLAAVSAGGRDAFRVGVGMIPRGEVTMVVAQLGLAMGVITRSVFGMVVVVAVATTLAAAPLTKFAFAGRKSPASAKLG